MPITATMDGLTDGLDVGDGALDPAQVAIQFVCTTASGHDPNEAPDDRVRPAHAALHGKVFELGAGAPIPPLDYGCRCAIRYVGKPGTQAARVLETVAPGEIAPSIVPATRAWLTSNAPEWEQVAKAASSALPQERAAVAYQVARELGYSREIARMAITASPFPLRAAEALGASILAGVGPAGRALVERWRAGNLAAAAKLLTSYPATYLRLLAEEPGLPRPPGG